MQQPPAPPPGAPPQIDPWRKGDLQYYRRVWHKTLVEWLLQGGGPHWRVDAAFLWSVGTWWEPAAAHTRMAGQGGMPACMAGHGKPVYCKARHQWHHTS